MDSASLTMERYGERVEAPPAVSAASRRRVLIPLCVLLAVWGQWALLTQRLVLDGVVLFSAAALIFVRYVLPGQRLINLPAPRLQTVGERLSWARVRDPLLVSLVCALLAWTFSDGNRLRPETVVFWALACALYLWAFWDRGKGEKPPLIERLATLARGSMVLPWTTVALALVFLVAAFFRYYQIDSIPAEMTSDHAEKLQDIQDVLNGEFRIFFPRNTGRETLEFYLAIPFVKTFGLSHLALKVLMATVSLLTIPLVYLIGKEIADERFGVLAAFFLAVSKWDVAIGRIGWRPPFYAFFTALSLYFLLRALRHGRRNDYLLCGLATGIGLYGYTSSRVFVLMIVVAVLAKLLFDARQGLRHALTVVGNTVLCFGMTLVVLIPLGHYMVENPQMFWLRTLSRVGGGEPQRGAVEVFRSNLANGFLMFNWRGDVAWVQNLSGDPHLDYVSGGLFILGVVWCLHSALVHRERVATYLLLALVVLMLPSVLSLAFPVENPAATRAVAEAPLAALLAAAALYLIARRMAEAWPGRTGRWLTAAGLVVVLVLMARVNFDRYFIDYASQYRQSARNSTEIAAVMKSFAGSVGSLQNAFIKDWPHWVDMRNVAINLGDPTWNNVLPNAEAVARHPAPPGNKLYLLSRADQDGVRRLQERYPQGQLRQQATVVPGQEFLVFFVPERQ